MTSIFKVPWRAAAVAVALACWAPPAKAVPSFARQTGLGCFTCHVSWPELTPTGRQFKLNGYTFGRRLAFPVAGMLQVALALPLLGSSAPARAGTARKEDFHYQDHPNEGRHCADCTAFVPPTDGQASGTCNIVAGPVSPDGWCMAFTPT